LLLSLTEFLPESTCRRIHPEPKLSAHSLSFAQSRQAQRYKEKKNRLSAAHSIPSGESRAARFSFDDRS
jgi:hypothetical protein